jgi:putative ABC transport system permease protein
MVISVLERRSEIGLRRALGAGRRHITAQCLCEALLLALLGGLAGAVIGASITGAYAVSRGWETVVPATGPSAAVVSACSSAACPASGRRCALGASCQPTR